jgi:hypothetical protein
MEIITTVILKVTVFCVMTPYRLGCRRSKVTAASIFRIEGENDRNLFLRNGRRYYVPGSLYTLEDIF